MLLTKEDARKCKTDALGTCTSVKQIYVADNHRLCELKLFKGDRDEMKSNCQTETSMNTVLFQAVNISDVTRAAAAQRKMELSKVYEGKPSKTIKVISPLSMIKLPLGWPTFEVSIPLLP